MGIESTFKRSVDRWTLDSLIGLSGKLRDVTKRKSEIRSRFEWGADLEKGYANGLGRQLAISRQRSRRYG